MTVYGADGSARGWVVATEFEVFVVPTLQREFIDSLTQGDALGIDMPIGLPSSTPRRCDNEARAFLGARRSTVFPCPPRVCLAAVDYSDALAKARNATGVGISKQAYHLLPRIGELDQVLSPADSMCVAEIHPECSFAAMNGDVPLPTKHAPHGVALRRRLLRRWYGPLPATPRGVDDHDVLDALAVLWSATRFTAGSHRSFGGDETDERGLPMRIIF
jgi:predicted RNase H-like nuclease